MKARFEEGKTPGDLVLIVTGLSEEENILIRQFHRNDKRKSLVRAISTDAVGGGQMIEFYFFGDENKNTD